MEMISKMNIQYIESKMTSTNDLNKLTRLAIMLKNELLFDSIRKGV